MSVSLLLERNIEISLLSIADDDDANSVFENINNVEWNPKELALLSRVNALMINHMRVYPTSVTRP